MTKDQSVHHEGINPLCCKCRRACRQPAGVLLIDCPRFLAYPFKIAEHRFVQLELFGKR